MENENQNWKVNHIWDDTEGNSTQWVYDNDSDFPYYIDYIEASEQYEVSHKYRRIYASKDLEFCKRFVERGENEL